MVRTAFFVRIPRLPDSFTGRFDSWWPLWSVFRREERVLHVVDGPRACVYLVAIPNPGISAIAKHVALNGNHDSPPDPDTSRNAPPTLSSRHRPIT